MEKFDKTDKSTIPKIQKVLAKNIPQELKEHSQWVLWKYFWDGKKWTKPPCDQHGNKCDHRKSSLSFKQAYKAHKKSDGTLGIGFSLRKEDKFCGGDLDNVIGPNRVKVKGLKKILKTFPGYVEESPSGTGYRIVGYGTPITRGAKKGSVIEVYTEGRYLTFTGKANGKAGQPLVDITGPLNWLGKHLSGEKPDPQVVGTGKNSLLADAGKPVLSTDFEKMLEYIPADDYQNEWLNVGMALHHEYRGSEEGFNLWDKWSSKSKKYGGPEVCWKKWQTFGAYAGAKVTGGKIHHLFKQNGGVLERVDPNLIPFETVGFKNQRELTSAMLPDSLKATVDEVARYIKTSESLVVSSMLSVFSACLGKSIRAIERGSIKHQCSLGFMQGVDTGGRKSAVDGILTKPFNDFERQQVKAWEAKQPEVEALLKSYQDQISGIRRRIKTGELDSLELSECEQKIQKLEVKINKIQQPCPRYIASDATEEQLSNLMAANNETMYVCSDEGRNVIANILGRYSGRVGSGQNISLYLCGFTGSTYKRDRVGMGRSRYIAVHLDKPCLNMMVKVQNDALLDLVVDERFIQSGLAARIFLGVYDMDIPEQFRTRGEANLNVAKLKAYDELVEKLLNICHKARGPWNVEFRLSEQATEAYFDFSEKYADMLEKGVWKGQEDVTNKVVSRSVVMAALLTAIDKPDLFVEKYIMARQQAKKAEQVNDSIVLPQVITVSLDMYKKACEIVEILTEQTLLVLKYSKDENDMKQCERIVNNVIRNVVEQGKHGGPDGYFPGSVVSQNLPPGLKTQWQEYLGIIIGHGHFVENPDHFGRYRLNKGLL